MLKGKTLEISLTVGTGTSRAMSASLRNRRARFASGTKSWSGTVTRYAQHQQQLVISAHSDRSRHCTTRYRRRSRTRPLLTGIDYIESQQKQLDAMMNHYEKEITAFATDSAKPLANKLPADKGAREGVSSRSLFQGLD